MLPKQSYLLILILVLISQTGKIFAQGNSVRINIGYGLWESFHIGGDLKLKNTSFGLDCGTSFKTAQFDDKYFSITLDNSFYWGKINSYESGSWYVNSRFIYWTFFETNSTWKVLQVCPSIGRDFRLNKSLGINIDAGPAILLHVKREMHTDFMEGWILPIYPEFGWSN